MTELLMNHQQQVVQDYLEALLQDGDIELADSDISVSDEVEVHAVTTEISISDAEQGLPSQSLAFIELGEPCAIAEEALVDELELSFADGDKGIALDSV